MFRIFQFPFLLLACGVALASTSLSTHDSLTVINTEHPKIGGHGLVVTGFDDACVSVDIEGEEQAVCGYVKVRNSWGSDAGDEGDYYITYKYLGVFLGDAYEIG